AARREEHEQAVHFAAARLFREFAAAGVERRVVGKDFRGVAFEVDTCTGGADRVFDFGEVAGFEADEIEVEGDVVLGWFLAHRLPGGGRDPGLRGDPELGSDALLVLDLADRVVEGELVSGRTRAARGVERQLRGYGGPATGGAAAVGRGHRGAD